MPHGVAAGLKRRNKLLTGAQFSAVFGEKKSRHGRHFSVHTRRNDLAIPRLGITVSKRVSKKAVERNRIKRQIRESFRLTAIDLPSLDCVVVTKVGAAQQENAVLRRELDGFWSRLIKPEP